jgi:hypothetical protein
VDTFSELRDLKVSPMDLSLKSIGYLDWRTTTRLGRKSSMTWLLGRQMPCVFPPRTKKACPQAPSHALPHYTEVCTYNPKHFIQGSGKISSCILFGFHWLCLCAKWILVAMWELNYLPKLFWNNLIVSNHKWTYFDLFHPMKHFLAMV